MTIKPSFPRFPGTKDPDESIELTFKGYVAEGDSIASVTITEVDVADVPVDPPAFTFGLVAIAPIEGRLAGATCTCDGSLANPVVTPGETPDPRLYLLRSRWTFASGKTRDRTMRLYVGHN